MMSRYHSSALGAGGSVHSAQTDFVMANYTSGMELNGRMSAVRRFFCLFVTFDLLFTAFFYIICILIGGQNLWTALSEQVVNYSIYTSFFDIVICSFVRFVLLLLFYGIIHISHWWTVAITTALSCAFLIAKTLIYHWNQGSSYPFEVLLLLISFVIAWTEAWFIDFRVRPAEARAKSILEITGTPGGFVEDRNDGSRGLDRVRDYLSQYTESVGNFYSPLESPEGSLHSGDENEFSHVRIVKNPKKLSAQEMEYVMCGEESLRLSWESINSSGWTLIKTITHRDVIFSKKNEKGRKVYKLMSTLDVSPESLFNECLHNFEEMPKWNRSIQKCKRLQVVTTKVDVLYQISTEGPGGVVSSRDFVTVRYWDKIGDSWIISGLATIHAEAPVMKGFVRGENGPTCLVFGSVPNNLNRCDLQWLLDVDLKGWIPGYVLEQALIHAITDFVSCIRKYSETIQQKTITGISG